MKDIDNMVEITKAIEWDMGHRIPNHSGKCRNPHGHRYRLELTLSGTVKNCPGSPEDGMIWDFGTVASILNTRIRAPLDHAFLASASDKLLQAMAAADRELKIVFVPFTPTVENLVTWCHGQIADAFSSTCQIARLRLYESPSSFADWIPPK